MALQLKYKRREHTDIEDILRGEKKYLELLEIVNTDKNWERFLGKIDEPKTFIKADNHFRILSNNISRVAATILIFILTATTIYLAKFQSHFAIQDVSNLENSTEIDLSDGSRITLNKGSVLSYHNHNNPRKREVQLRGEAFFNVAKNDAVPFYVYLDKTIIKVLGTSFNVNENTDGDVEIYVLSGKVSFYESENENNSVLIRAGEGTRYNNTTKEFKTSQFSSQNFLFWITGNLSFNHQNLKEVFNVLEKSYNVTIQVEDPEILNNKLTSDCEGLQLKDILNELSILFNLSYSQDGHIVYIQKE